MWPPGASFLNIDLRVVLRALASQLASRLRNSLQGPYSLLNAMNEALGYNTTNTTAPSDRYILFCTCTLRYLRAPTTSNVSATLCVDLLPFPVWPPRPYPLLNAMSEALGDNTTNAMMPSDRYFSAIGSVYPIPRSFAQLHIPMQKACCSPLCGGHFNLASRTRQFAT